MRPVLTTEEMSRVDAETTTATEVLVERAGAAVARAALRLLGGSYGRRAVVVAGKGHNGDDGRVAARRLSRRGVRVILLDAASAPGRLPPADVVVDAAYGTGFKGEYRAPDPGPGTAVLAVDIPSGVAGDTGEAGAGAVAAEVTVTFAALKPGLLCGEGPERAGLIEVADIGLDVSRARIGAVEDADVVEQLPGRPREAHKWQSAVAVVAGSPGMMGSAKLCSAAAMRSGAGMVRLGVPGASPSDLPADETVATTLPAAGWERDVLELAQRCRSLVVGPGLGRGATVESAVRRLVAEAAAPMVVDADGLNALGSVDEVATLVAGRDHDVVLTPHAGELARLIGRPPGPDRLAEARHLARATGAVALLKGSTTVVAAPDGAARLVVAGSSRLATAGTGDVLSGVIGAFLARGVRALDAAALGAHVHARAASLGRPVGLTAGDLPDLISLRLSERR